MSIYSQYHPTDTSSVSILKDDFLLTRTDYEKEMINSFEDVIRESMDQGAAEALGILNGKDLADDDVVSVANRTMELVHERFDAFFEELRGGAEA